MRAPLLASLWIFLATAPQQAPPRDLRLPDVAAQSGTASISGRVRAAGSGAAVAALVVLVPAPRLESSTAASWRAGAAKSGVVTDRSGGFSISGISAGTYRLIAAPSSHSGRYLAAGYGATRANDPGKAIVVRDGDDIRNADITLPTALGEGGDRGRCRHHRCAHYVVAVENSPFAPTPVTWPGTRNFGGSFTMAPEPTTFVTTFYPSTLSESSAQRVRLTPPNDAIGIDITLIRSGRCQVSGTVLDSQGVPTFRREQDGRLEIVLTSRSSTVEGQIKSEADASEATVYVFSDDRQAWSMSSPRTVFSDVPEGGRFSVSGLVAGRYHAIAIAREGFRPPSNPGAAFFELLSKDATAFTIGDDERRSVNLTLWRWPE